MGAEEQERQEELGSRRSSERLEMEETKRGRITVAVCLTACGCHLLAYLLPTKQVRI
jgi:hypothetical protein